MSSRRARTPRRPSARAGHRGRDRRRPRPRCNRRRGRPGSPGPRSRHGWRSAPSARSRPPGRGTWRAAGRRSQITRVCGFCRFVWSFSRRQMCLGTCVDHSTWEEFDGLRPSADYPAPRPRRAGRFCSPVRPGSCSRPLSRSCSPSPACCPVMTTRGRAGRPAHRSRCRRRSGRSSASPTRSSTRPRGRRSRSRTRRTAMRRPPAHSRPPTTVRAQPCRSTPTRSWRRLSLRGRCAGRPLGRW